MMTEALDIILQRGVRFRLPAPLWRRILGGGVVRIKPPRVGTALAILREAVAYDLASEEVSALFESVIAPRQLVGVKRIVATAVLGVANPSERKLEVLVARLDNVLLQDLLHLYSIVMTMCRGEDFRTATLSVWALMRLLRVRSQEEMGQGSEDSIASSESSENGKEIEG